MATTGDRLTTQEANVTIQKGTKVLTPPARTRPTTPAEQEADTVQVWPHLVVIEFLGAVIITINMVLLSTLINGVFLDLANPDRTPNPSKAPWYFLNLQELLLHMNPALAGVIVPTIALVLLAIIPYVDRGQQGLGIWFYNDRGPKIVIFTLIFSTLVCAGLVYMDEELKLRSVFEAALTPADAAAGTSGGILSFLTDMTTNLMGGGDKAQAEAFGTLIEAIAGWIVPTLIMIFFTVLLIVLLKVMFKGLTLSEAIIGLFTGFVAVYAVLTFVGTAMRGPGMELFPPWDVPPPMEG